MIEHKNHLDNYPTTTSNEDMSNAIKEDLQKLEDNNLRVKQCNILLEEISKKRKETNELVSEKLNSVIGRCEAMSDKIADNMIPHLDTLTEKCKATLNKLNNLHNFNYLSIKEYFKSSLFVGGLGIVGCWGLTYLLKNPQILVTASSWFKKLLFGDTSNLIANIPVGKIAKKTTEKLVKDNNLKTNMVFGLSAASATLLIQKIIRLFKKWF